MEVGEKEEPEEQELLEDDCDEAFFQGMEAALFCDEYRKLVVDLGASAASSGGSGDGDTNNNNDDGGGGGIDGRRHRSKAESRAANRFFTSKPSECCSLCRHMGHKSVAAEEAKSAAAFMRHSKASQCESPRR